jgi:predicted DCC family thiol-disulfide oxidoreductase YuxK
LIPANTRTQAHVASYHKPVPDDAPPLAKPLLLWDGKCGFCKIWIHYFKQITGDRIDYATSQQRGAEFPQIPPEDFGKSVQLSADGSVVSGGRVFFEITGHQRIYQASRPFRWITETAYKFIATHRNLFYHVTRLRSEPGSNRRVLEPPSGSSCVCCGDLRARASHRWRCKSPVSSDSAEFFRCLSFSRASARISDRPLPRGPPAFFGGIASDGALTGICWAGRGPRGRAADRPAWSG